MVILAPVRFVSDILAAVCQVVSFQMKADRNGALTSAETRMPSSGCSAFSSTGFSQVISPNLTTLFIKGNRRSSCLSVCGEFWFPANMQSHLNKPVTSSGKRASNPVDPTKTASHSPWSVTLQRAACWRPLCSLPHGNMGSLSGWWLHLATARGPVSGHRLRELHCHQWVYEQVTETPMPGGQ